MRISSEDLSEIGMTSVEIIVQLTKQAVTNCWISFMKNYETDRGRNIELGK